MATPLIELRSQLAAREELVVDDLSELYRSILWEPLNENKAGFGREFEMRDVLRGGRARMSGMWASGIEKVGSQELTSDEIKRLRVAYLRMGYAAMLTEGDWIIDRQEEIPRGMGVIPFQQFEEQMYAFYQENGQLEGRDFQQNPLIHFDLGCGNAVVSHNLRQASDGRWAQFGYADKIYFALNQLLWTNLKEECRSNGVVLEFVDMVSTLLLRRVRHLLGCKIDNDLERKLRQLPSHPEYLYEILPQLGHYISELSGFQNEDRLLRADEQYLEDVDRRVSPDCRKIVQEYFTEGGAAFLEKYFIPQMREDGNKLRQITDIDAGLETMSEYRNLRAELIRDRDRIAGTLAANDITIYPHNVLLGSFENFEEVVPEVPAFNFVHSYRATAHAEDALYAQMVRQVALRLKSGGVYIDDGYREAYTQYERMDLLLGLQQELGPDFKVSYIGDADSARSIVIERVLSTQAGERVFFSDDHAENILLEGCHLAPIQDYETRYPKQVFRNRIVHRLRELLVSDFDVDPPDLENKHDVLTAQRMQFKPVHTNGWLDELLEDHVFSQSAWQRLTGGSESVAYEALYRYALEMVEDQFDHVREATLRERDRAFPYSPEARVSVLPRAVSLLPSINEPRSVSISELPRNSEIPTLADPSLERDRNQLVGNLYELKELLHGQTPLHLVEFDDCFTNQMMISTLCSIMGKQDALDSAVFEGHPLVRVENVVMQSRRWPEPKDGITMGGGSLNDTYDEWGGAFTNEFSVPYLESIERGAPRRGLGICFSSQSFWQALGTLRGKHFRTEVGGLQFGYFPTIFSDGDHPALKHLGGKVCSTIFTRSGYSMVDGYEDIPDVKVLAREGHLAGDQYITSLDRPPAAASLLGGRVLVSQFHPEARLREEKLLGIIREFLEGATPSIDQNFACQNFSPTWQQPSGQSIFVNNIDLRGRIQKDMGLAWLIPALNSLTTSLIHQLKSQH